MFQISWETSEKSNQSVFNYMFSDGITSSLSSELPYIFGYNNFTSAGSRDLRNQMMTFWTSFATTGFVFDWPLSSACA